MKTQDAIKHSIDMAEQISLGYLGDLSDEDLMRRPCEGCNHINWQVGHLIVAENGMLGGVLPGSLPPLPAGFAEKYTKETATSDDPKAFATKAELMEIYTRQHAAMLKALAAQSDSDLDKPSGMDWAPTLAALFSMQGAHWLMHCGQWVIVRRQLGHKAMY